MPLRRGSLAKRHFFLPKARVSQDCFEASRESFAARISKRSNPLYLRRDRGSRTEAPATLRLVYNSNTLCNLLELCVERNGSERTTVYTFMVWFDLVVIDGDLQLERRLTSIRIGFWRF